MRILRQRRHWRQVDLVARAGVPRWAVSLLELGRAGELRLDTIERIGRALEARVIVRVDWRGEAIDRLLDSAHAALVDDTVRRLGRAGWIVETEVSFEIRGERGSTDVLAWHPVERVLLVVEVKSAFGDLQATLMVLDRKVRLAPVVARRFGWEVISVGRLLVVGEGRTARRVVDAHAALFRTAFPLRGRAAARWLAAPTRARFSGLLCCFRHLLVGSALRAASGSGGRWWGRALERPRRVRAPRRLPRVLRRLSRGLRGRRALDSARYGGR